MFRPCYVVTTKNLSDSPIYIVGVCVDKEDAEAMRNKLRREGSYYMVDVIERPLIEDDVN